jgi:hypothetical protein
VNGGPTPVEHLLTRISDALALDGRVGELGLDVHEEAGPLGRRIVVSGHVSTAERKHAIAVVVGEVLAAHDDDAEVDDRTVVTVAGRPDAEGEVV